MKKKIIFTVVILLVLVTAGSAFYLNFGREKNVFDQMYYTRVHTNFDSWNPGNFRGMFANMKQLENVSRDAEQSFTQEGYFFETYKTEYLSENAGLSIVFFTSSREIIIEYDIGEEDPTLTKWYCYKYNVDEKSLTYTTNDPDDTNNKEFLYTILLNDWFSANPHTRFSIDNLGKYNFIDESDR